jgi:hypothetical protein
VNALTLAAVLIALGLSGTTVPGLSLYGQMIAGVVLLVLLFAYDREGYRSMWQCFAFAGVAGACVATIASGILDLAGIPVERGVSFALSTTPPARLPAAPFPWTPVIWIGVTLIFWAVDMSRMQKRFAMQYAGVPQPAPVVMPPPVREEPVRPQPVVAPPPPPPPAPPPAAPSLHRATNVTSLFSQPSIERQPEPVVRSEPAPAPAQPGLAPPTVPVPAPAQAVPVPRGSGKPVTIYLNLVGEGLAVMRSVQAEHIGKDYYLIVEPMPPGETWEFTTGQVVRCQKRNLSSGKGLVAVEEAPRAS